MFNLDSKLEYENNKNFIIDELKQKVKKHVYQTVLQEREDLEQEMWIKIIQYIDKMWDEDVPNFFEFVEQLDKPVKQQQKT